MPRTLYCHDMRFVKVPKLAFTMLAAGAMTTLGAVPVFLLSAQSVFIRDDLRFDEAQFGLAVSSFFGSAALTALLGGSLADRLGRRRSTVIAGALAAIGSAGVAGIAFSYPALVAALVVLGVANASLQVTANLSLATSVPLPRQGLAFGIKQSAVPFAILLGGLSVPTIGALIGWRWTFGITAAFGVIVAATGLFLPRDPSRSGGPGYLGERPPSGALALTAIAMAVASASVNSLGAFLASWGFFIGLTPVEAGLLMAAGSGLSIVSRVISGHAADRRGGRNLPVVAQQLALGAVGLAVVSIGTVPTLIPGAILAFAVGWAWPGLLLFAVVRVSRDTPGAASGALQAGAFAGGASGPALFGLLVAGYGYPLAWRVAAVLLLVAAALLIAARRAFVADIRERPLP